MPSVRFRITHNFSYINLEFFISCLCPPTFQIHLSVKDLHRDTLSDEHVTSVHHLISSIRLKTYNNNNNNNNNNNWFLQRKSIEPTQIPVTSWQAGSTLTVDSP